MFGKRIDLFKLLGFEVRIDLTGWFLQSRWRSLFQSGFFRSATRACLPRLGANSDSYLLFPFCERVSMITRYAVASRRAWV
jgi:hypothetical protein